MNVCVVSVGGGALGGYFMSLGLEDVARGGRQALRNRTERKDRAGECSIYFSYFIFHIRFSLGIFEQQERNKVDQINQPKYDLTGSLGYLFFSLVFLPHERLIANISSAN